MNECDINQGMLLSAAGRGVELLGAAVGGSSAAHSPNTFTYSTADLTDIIVLGSRWSAHRLWCFGLILDEVIAEDGKKWVYIKVSLQLGKLSLAKGQSFIFYGGFQECFMRL